MVPWGNWVESGGNHIVRLNPQSLNYQGKIGVLVQPVVTGQTLRLRSCAAGSVGRQVD
jgi:hypothetical protein